MTRYSPFFFLTLFLFACNRIPENVRLTLDLSGGNRKELEAVINHYQAPEDSLKLQAAYFLIGNMESKFFHPYNKSQGKFIDVLDSINHNGISLSHKDLMKCWEEIKVKNNSPSSNAIMDYNVVTSAFLISNIDSAFYAWENAPWADHYSFEDFCEYVLPYRNAYDIPGEWRESFNTRYSWALDAKDRSIDLLKVCGHINDSLKWFGWGQMFYEYPQMNIQDLEKTKRGCCRQQSSLKIGALRSIGLPVAQVYAAHGTSWVSILDKDGEFVDYGSFNKPEKGRTYEGIREERYSKVFMQTYEIQPDRFDGMRLQNIPPLFRSRYIKDVTTNHTSTSDVNLHLEKGKASQNLFAYLCVFDPKSKKWDAIDVSAVKDGEIGFKQLGRERIYLPAYYEADGYHQLSDPFYITAQGQIITLKLDADKLSPAKLYRKSHLNTWEHRFATLMIGTVFEGANDPGFKGAVELFEILEMPEYKQEASINQLNKFRYVRYKSDTIMRLSDIGFFEEKDDQPLKGKILYGLDTLGIKNLFDGDTHTNFNGGIGSWVGLDLGKPTRIDKVEYMFRNSFNTVESGDLYELFYWDGKWVSLGEKTAEDDYLVYNTPANAILWFKNLTKGKEEMIFFMKDGKQVWG